MDEEAASLHQDSNFYDTPTPMQQIKVLQDLKNPDPETKSHPPTPEAIAKRQSLNLIKPQHMSIASANFREYIEIMGSQSYKPKFESQEKIEESQFASQVKSKKDGFNSRRQSTISDADSVKIIKTDHEDNGQEITKPEAVTKTPQHLDTSPRRMNSIQESDDVNLPTIPKTSNKTVSQNDEQSTRERVAKLERKFGGYRMTSKQFDYDDLKLNPNFQIIKFKDAIYRGLIVNTDKREGSGVMVYDNGRIYEGQWQHDKRHGQGFEKYSNGNTYEGEFQNGKASGEGVYKWKNGEYYEGNWLNGVKHGQGSWKNQFGESYVGEWRENKANGKGTHVWNTGDKYEGDWQQFLKHGYGTDYFANGDQYSGEYRYGKPCGRGKYLWATGAVYEGDFDDGKKCGQGKWEKKTYRDDGHLDTHVYYIGEYGNDMKNGYGEYKWASGNLYKGHYCDDKRHGYGEMHWNDGSTYQGEWHNGVQHGFGRMIFANGETKEGLFEGGAYKVEGSEDQIRNLMKNTSSNMSGSNQTSSTINNNKTSKQKSKQSEQSNMKSSRIHNKLGQLTNSSMKKQASAPDLKVGYNSHQQLDIKRKLLPAFATKTMDVSSHAGSIKQRHTQQIPSSHHTPTSVMMKQQYAKQPMGRNNSMLPSIVEQQSSRKHPQSMSPQRKWVQQQSDMLSPEGVMNKQYGGIRRHNNSVLQNVGQQVTSRQQSSQSVNRQESQMGAKPIWVPSGVIHRHEGVTINTKVQLI